jgi:CheY-like chemotaxis protein
MATRLLQDRFKPGERVPDTGVYHVFHRRHRAAHESSLLQGEVFPNCNKCGDHVRFQLVLASGQPQEQPSSGAPALLLVDEEPAVAYTLKRVLEGEGYEVSTAESYSRALGLLQCNEYDVVITEINLQRDAEGLDLVRAAQNLKPPPVVIMSAADPTEPALRAALKLRVNYLVFKPIDLPELKSALSKNIARRALILAGAV